MEKVEKAQDFFKIILSKGNLLILEKLSLEKSTIQFKHFKLLINPKTGKKYSTRTISESLKELDSLGLIENEIVTSTRGKTIAYSLTKKGESTYDIVKDAEEKYKKIK